MLLEPREWLLKLRDVRDLDVRDLLDTLELTYGFLVLFTRTEVSFGSSLGG